MSKLNKVFLMGNLTKDPELRYTPAGTAIAEFGMAINREWQGSDGEKKKEVCYVQVNMFGKRAEVINEYFSKGKPIFIEGRLKFEQWEAKDGGNRNTLKVVAENFEFIGGQAGGNGSGTGPSFPEGSSPNDVNEDEIPF
jgi:single-strand DNA-binding protein